MDMSNKEMIEAAGYRLVGVDAEKVLEKACNLVNLHRKALDDEPPPGEGGWRDASRAWHWLFTGSSRHGAVVKCDPHSPDRLARERRGEVLDRLEKPWNNPAFTLWFAEAGPEVWVTDEGAAAIVAVCRDLFLDGFFLPAVEKARADWLAQEKDSHLIGISALSPPDAEKALSELPALREAVLPFLRVLDPSFAPPAPSPPPGEALAAAGLHRFCAEDEFDDLLTVLNLVRYECIDSGRNREATRASIAYFDLRHAASMTRARCFRLPCRGDARPLQPARLRQGESRLRPRPDG